MKKIAFILGTRPEIIKLYSLISDASKFNFDYFIIHTNQHYDEKMDKIFFDELDLAQPKYNLNIGSSSQSSQVAKMMIGMEDILLSEKPDFVFVQGDTNSVLAGSLVSSKLGIKLCHVEAGLRSYDRTMPEEINRIVTDHISDFLFSPTTYQQKILIKEGIDENKIVVTGNTIVDAVLRASELSKKKSDILENLCIKKDSFFLLTCHRPSNTDNIENFNQIISGISNLCDSFKLKCIFPAHPRLKNKLTDVRNNTNFIVIDPVGYLDMLQLQINSKMIFTDSGGIQEESCILQKKCLILRTNTERPETVEVGGAVLIDEVSEDSILKHFDILIGKQVSWYNPFGDGKSSEIILNFLNKL